MATYHHGDLRAALLQAAAELLEEQGLAALSVRETARRAGVSHNAPYRHFPNRDSLLAALAAEGFRMLDEALAAKGTRESGEAYVRFALAHPQRFQLMFTLRHPELRPKARGIHRTLERAFTGLGADANVAGAAAWSLMHGLAQLLVDGHFENSAGFAKTVLGAMRFAVAARPLSSADSPSAGP